MSNNPIEIFKDLIKKAETIIGEGYNAMSLATADSKFGADVRIVLLKDYCEEGFSFYTNKLSAKANQIKINNKAALMFFWKELGVQIRIRGEVKHILNEVSDAYFASRPRESQIGAHASKQSMKLNNRQDLINCFEEIASKYSNNISVPRPDNWGGYILVPEEIEFWYNGEHRLHNRILYKRSNNIWSHSLLYP